MFTFINLCPLIELILLFLLQVLVEKLLRECPDISKIYILIRPKNGVSPDARLDEFINSKFFRSCARVEEQFLREKLVVVPGDITKPNFNMSPESRQLLIENVNIVFHSAASVKFDDPLR